MDTSVEVFVEIAATYTRLNEIRNTDKQANGPNDDQTMSESFKQPRASEDC